MDQTRFDVLQTTFEVVTNLLLDPAQHRTRGKQFTMTLIVERGDGTSLPLDIYVNRLDDGVNAMKVAVDGTKRADAQASINPDGETFAIEIGLERSRDPKNARPEVRVSPDMFRILREVRDVRDKQAVEALLENLGLQ